MNVCVRADYQFQCRRISELLILCYLLPRKKNEKHLTSQIIGNFPSPSTQLLSRGVHK